MAVDGNVGAILPEPSQRGHSPTSFLMVAISCCQYLCLFFVVRDVYNLPVTTSINRDNMAFGGVVNGVILLTVIV